MTADSLQSIIGIPARASGARSPADVATALMLADNEVTHINELVNAPGAQLQVHYVRDLTPGNGPPAIAEGHGSEDAVWASDEVLYAGAVHALLIVVLGPRHDGAEAFRERLAAELAQAE